MKFGQLIEYNMRNIFLKRSCTKCGQETLHRPLSKKSNWAKKLFSDHFLKKPKSYPWTKSLKFYTVCFYRMPSWGLLKYIETKLQTTCFYLTHTHTHKKKKSLPPSFSEWFLKKNISLVIFYYLTKFHCLAAFTSWDIGQYMYYNCLLTRWRHKCWS